MNIDIITLFPEAFIGPLSSSILKRAQEKRRLVISTHNLRKWTIDKRGTVDDRPYGGGPGMILMVEPIDKAISELRTKDSYIIFVDPSGKKFNQRLAGQLALKKHLIFVCGHYEGIDERAKTSFAHEIISIGDYILTGGELPTMVIVDSVVRLMPGVLNKEESTREESFNNNLLEYPQYTRPETYKNMRVPKVLVSGHHGEIEKWRKKQSMVKTKKNRPDLL